MHIAPEVRQALLENRPVVALETTIISHGMPYPESVQTALEVERIIRENGAVPATIGIIDGEPIIGLTPAQLDAFGTRRGIWKVSRRDLPIVMAKREWGATTVAATMILAAQAGIRFFVTGGIGGVQRGWESTLDISADLEELARTSVCVICAGAKYILDIPATMEVYKACIQRGYTTAFIDAGCIVSTPTCGPCLGGYMGILAEGERCVSTTNRNFVGRMGHVNSEVYLASPATAAASALTGHITDPREV